jgi:hypothetical protein
MPRAAKPAIPVSSSTAFAGIMAGPASLQVVAARMKTLQWPDTPSTPAPGSACSQRLFPASLSDVDWAPSMARPQRAAGRNLMKPKTEESRSIPPPRATRYPAMGAEPAPAVSDSAGAAVKVRAERDGPDAVSAGAAAAVVADGGPADAAGSGTVSWPDGLSWLGGSPALGPVAGAGMSTGAGAAGSTGEGSGAEGPLAGPPERQDLPAAAGTCLSGQGAALTGNVRAKKPAAMTDSTARTRRTSRPLHMSSNATRSGGLRPATRLCVACRPLEAGRQFVAA